MVLGILFASKPSPDIWVKVILCSADLVTDLVYILAQPFSSIGLRYVCVAVICIQLLPFLWRTGYQHGWAVTDPFKRRGDNITGPSPAWLSNLSAPGRPLHLIAWIVCSPGYRIFCVLRFVAVIVSFVMWLPIGWLLYHSKLLHLKWVADRWSKWWMPATPMRAEELERLRKRGSLVYVGCMWDTQRLYLVHILASCLPTIIFQNVNNFSIGESRRNRMFLGVRFWS